MSLALMLVLQAAAPAAQPPAPAAIDFDLARYRPADARFGLTARPCPGRDPTTIVVCGRRSAGGAYPFEEMARLFAARPLVAETRLSGNVIGDVHGESVTLDRGAVSHRAMVRLRLGF
ncbi:MAG TPA: hypothetical protein VES64_09030 [Allosphingosinicella sp.]|nr:hypothetical protein [Allosphingosinicella sp.]